MPRLSWLSRTASLCLLRCATAKRMPGCRTDRKGKKHFRMKLKRLHRQVRARARLRWFVCECGEWEWRAHALTTTLPSSPTLTSPTRGQRTTAFTRQPIGYARPGPCARYRPESSSDRQLKAATSPAPSPTSSHAPDSALAAVRAAAAGFLTTARQLTGCGTRMSRRKRQCRQSYCRICQKTLL